MLGDEELDRLAELERVARGRGIVTQLALARGRSAGAGAGRVEGEEVGGDGGESVEDELAAVVEFLYFRGKRGARGSAYLSGRK